MKKLSLFITGFLTYTGTAQAVQEPQQLDLGELDLMPSTIADSTKLQSNEAASPVVKKFAGNFYEDDYWSNSVYYDYLGAFWTGYNMQSYTYATTCVDNFNLFMDVFHNWKLTAVRQKKKTEFWDLFFMTAGTDANETWYNCYLFYNDFTDTYKTKWENFNDFGDIYLSFIFNMLSNSLNIKSQTENMIDAYEIHQTETFIQALASVLRSILDFDSYSAVSSALTTDEGKTPTKDEFLGMSKAYKKTVVPTKWERLAVTEARLVEAQRKMDENDANLRKEQAKFDQEGKKSTVQLIHSSIINNQRKGAQVGREENYEWKARDYIQAPLAFVIGSLHALPADTDGPNCSGNSTALRSMLLEGAKFQDKKEPLEAALAYYNGGSYLDEVGVDCQVALSSTLSAEYWTALAASPQTIIPTNLVYNIGYMWVDIVNYSYFTAETVPQNDWGFFVAYLLGDFIIRIFYHDNTPQQVNL